ncbi:MAG: LacI family DNA-binding transcriptional regulator [Bacteroidales bacterium]|nr:LacI family DNA-binding transcriptional regulator [Bacteroidales bacterium]
MNKVTIYDIAKALNTTASTVSRALQDNPRISKKMKARVLALADELNFHPNPVAAHLRTGRSLVIGVIVPRINRNFFASVIGGIEEVAYENGYSVIFSQSNEDYETEKSIAKTFLMKKVDALAVSLSAQTTDYSHFKPFINKGIPIVFFDRVPDSLEVSKVEIDNYTAAYQAVEHFIEQGCKKIFHLAGPLTLSVYRNRLNGYLSAMRDHGLTVEENWIFSNAITLESGTAAVEKMIQINDLPEAILAAGDFSAMGVMMKLKSEGIKIPEQVALIGIANESFSEFVEPQLTTIDLFSHQLGETSAKILIEQLSQEISERKNHHIQFPPKLIIRGSSLKITKIN